MEEKMKMFIFALTLREKYQYLICEQICGRSFSLYEKNGLVNHNYDIKKFLNDN